MHWTAFLTCLLTVSLMDQVSGLETVNGKYGDTVEIPCNNGPVTEKAVTLVKWKYNNEGNILVKKPGQNATISNDENYKNRVSIRDDLGLIIRQVTMADQKIFTCMMVMDSDIFENAVQLVIYKIPSQPQITNQTTTMAVGKLTKLAQCRTEGANPAANITWFKNKTPLTADGAAIKITAAVVVDKETGLSATTSDLEYTAVKEDIDASFTCRVQHIQSVNMDSSPLIFTVNYPSEKVSLQVVSQGPFKEGDNVTLKCIADGNPPPSSYIFYVKGEKKTVENSNTYTLTNVTRANTGEYKCSLLNNEDMAGSVNITVEFLDVALSTTGQISKRLGESFEVTPDIKASGKTEILWRKNNKEQKSGPIFDKLKYSDSGVYECVVSMAGLKKTQKFELIVQGSPVIKSLTKARDGNKNKVLSCEAEGSPKPTVQWSVNGTNVGETNVDGRVIYKITIVPKVNLTVSCTVSNALGSVNKSIDVSPLFEDQSYAKQDLKDDKGEQTVLAVGIVFGLIVAVIVIGLAYWLYMKKFRQGSWKTGEKEDGSAEESKKLEENQSQKADV